MAKKMEKGIENRGKFLCHRFGFD